MAHNNQAIQCTYFVQTHVIKVNVVSCGSKNKYHKDMCLKQTGLRAQNMIAILDSIIIITDRTYMTI